MATKRKSKKVRRSKKVRTTVPRGFVDSGENKYLDITNATYAMNTTGSITHLDIVPQGTTVNSREGRRFKVQSLLLRGDARADTTTTITQGAAYVIWDRQPNKVLAAITDFLDTASSYSFIKKENEQRFDIVWRGRYDFSGNTTAPAASEVTFGVDETIPLGNRLAECTSADTTGVIGNRVTGALLLVTVGNTVAGTADCNIILTGRLHFVG